MKITYFGTTTLLFDDGIDQLLFDAQVSRPSMKKAFFCKMSSNEQLIDRLIEKHQINRLRGIFISHSHYDHVMDAPSFSIKCGAQIYGSESTLNVARGGNVKEENLVLFAHGDEIVIGNYKITILHSAHSEAKWYNDDLGKTIDNPLRQPAKKKEYKEGGSYDFLVENGEKKYLIRPSFNYVKDELDMMKVDILFMGISGLSKASKDMEKTFFEQTVERVNPKLIIPIHWDNFFAPIEKPIKVLPELVENTSKSMFEVQKYCEEHNISYCVQLPLTSIEV